MRILVTGAAGFIGAHLTARLLRDGHAVTGIDAFTPYYDVQFKHDRWAALVGRAADDGQEARLITCDVCDGERLQGAFAEFQPERVVHLAAQPGMRASLNAPFVCQKNNVEGFLSLLECCRHAAVTPRLVYASSSSVYGNSAVLPFTEEQPADRPVSLYAATKRANELMAHTYAQLYGIPCVGLRLFTAYGPWCRPDMALYLFADALSQRRPLQVFQGGDVSRDFTHIDDVVEGIVRCIDMPLHARYELFNVGSGRPVVLLSAVRLLAEKLGVTPQIEVAPLPPGDIPATWASLARIQARTGYQPATTLEEGLDRFVAWFRAYALAGAGNGVAR